jgi:hypothetical protein
MPLKARPIALFALSLFFLARLDASTLVWGTDKISTEIIEGEQTEVKAAFPFKNTGDHPVTITGARPSCGCTTAVPDKKTYAPGESGEIAVVFHPGERTGKQGKYITVITDETEQPTKQLLFEINIRPCLAIEPSLLKWRMGGKSSEQLIILSGLPSHPITEITAQDDPAGTFSTRIEVVEKGQKYKLYVKPISTAKQLTSILTIKAKFANSNDRKTDVYVYVDPSVIDQSDDD